MDDRLRGEPSDVCLQLRPTRRAANALWFSAQRLPLQRNLRTLLRDFHAHRAPPCLSTDEVLRHRTDLLRLRLEELRRDLAAG